MRLASILIITSILILIGCDHERKEINSGDSSISDFNLNEEEVSQFNWMNKPVEVVFLENALQITTSEGSDFFNNPEDSSIVGTAPFL